MELKLHVHDIPIDIGVHRVEPQVDGVSRRCGIEFHDGLEVADLLLGILLEQLEEDRFLGFEVRVDSPFGVASFSGDHVNRRESERGFLRG